MTDYPLDVGNFVSRPTAAGSRSSMEVFPDCDDARLHQEAPRREGAPQEQRPASTTGCSCATGTRGRTARARISSSGPARAAGRASRVDLMKGMDGDVPSQALRRRRASTRSRPTARRVVFSARTPARTRRGRTELRSVPRAGRRLGAPRNLTDANPRLGHRPAFSPDGRTLAYRAMKRRATRPTASRSWCCDLAERPRRASSRPAWDRSADGIALVAPTARRCTPPRRSRQARRCSRIDVASGKRDAVAGGGTRHRRHAAGDRRRVRPRHLRSPARAVPSVGATAASRALTALQRASSSPATACRRARAVHLRGLERRDRPRLRGEAVGLRAGQEVSRRVHHPRRSAGLVRRPLPLPLEPADLRRRGLCRGVRSTSTAPPATGRRSPTRSPATGAASRSRTCRRASPHALAAYPLPRRRARLRARRSYGGYMVNWIAGNWHDRSSAWSPTTANFDKRRWPTTHRGAVVRRVGAPRHAVREPGRTSRSTTRWRTSRSGTTPMLVIHGALDYRVPVEQGIATFTALQRRGVAEPLPVLPGREPLGAEAAELHPVARHRQRLAGPLATGTTAIAPKQFSGHLPEPLHLLAQGSERLRPGKSASVRILPGRVVLPHSHLARLSTRYRPRRPRRSRRSGWRSCSAPRAPACA